MKGALFNTRLPKVTAALMDGGNVDLTLSEDPFDSVRLQVDSIPILVTICKIGEHCVVDPSAEEEVCSSASLVVGVSVREENGKLKICHTGVESNTIAVLIIIVFLPFFKTNSHTAYITNIRTGGAGSFHMETLNKCLEVGKSAGQCLDKVLLRVLREEDRKIGNRLVHTERFGFLR